MPKSPRGHKRPADVIGNAVHVMKVATGELEEPDPVVAKDAKAVARGKAGGRKGGKSRAEALSPHKRKQIGKRAAEARWKARQD